MAFRYSPNLEITPSQLEHPPDKSFSPHQDISLPDLNSHRQNLQKGTGFTRTKRNPDLSSLSEFPKLNSSTQDQKESCISSYSKSWKDIVNENQCHGISTQLTFYEPSIKDNIRYANIDQNLITEARKRWQYSIAFYVYGNKPYYKYLKEYIDRTWQIKDGYQLYSRENGFYIIKLNTQEDRERILAGGPYFYNKRLIFMKKWQPGMKLSREFLHSIPIWIQLPNLDLDFWSVEAISRIASVLGNPVKLDHNTEDVIRISFARILVEIDINCTFPTEIPIQCFDGSIIWQKVTYEWIPHVCPNCKIFGHSDHSCMAKKVWRKKENSMEVDSSDQLDEMERNNELFSSRKEDNSHSSSNNIQSNQQGSDQVPATLNFLNDNGVNLLPADKNKDKANQTPVQRNITTENRYVALNSINVGDSEDITTNIHNSVPVMDNINTKKVLPEEEDSPRSKEDTLDLNEKLNDSYYKSDNEDNCAQDTNMEDSDFLTVSYKQKRNKINLNKYSGDEVIIDGEPFVESNPKWNNLVAHIKSKSKNKRIKEDFSLSGGVKSKGVSKK